MTYHPMNLYPFVPIVSQALKVEQLVCKLLYMYKHVPMIIYPITESPPCQNLEALQPTLSPKPIRSLTYVPPYESPFGTYPITLPTTYTYHPVNPHPLWLLIQKVSHKFI